MTAVTHGKPIASQFALLSVALVAITVTPLANYGAYIAMIAAVLAILAVPFGGPRPLIRWELFPVLFVIAYALIGIAIIASAQTTADYLIVFDFLPIGLAVFLYWLLRPFSKNTLSQALALACLIGAGLGVAIGLYQIVALGQPRANGIGGSAIHYGNISLLLGFLALLPLLEDKTNRWTWLFVLGPALGICAALLSGTRATFFIGACLALNAMAFFAIARGFRIRARYVAGIGLALAIALAVGISMGNLDRLSNTIDTLSEIIATGETDENSMMLRLDMWRSGAAAFQDAPIFGHGWHNVVGATEQYREIAPRGATRHLHHLHNDVINFSVTLGLLGVFAYAMILAAPLASLFPLRQSNPTAAYAVTSIVGTLILAGLTNVNFLYEAPKVAFCFLAAAAAALARAQIASNAGNLHPLTP